MLTSIPTLELKLEFRNLLLSVLDYTLVSNDSFCERRARTVEILRELIAADANMMTAAKLLPIL